MPDNHLLLGRSLLCVAAISLVAATGYARPLRLLTGDVASMVHPAGGNSDSFAPIMTPDARYVVFASSAQNLCVTENFQLIPASSARLNVFMRDRVEGTTSLVSVNTNGSLSAEGNSLPCGVSSDGRYVVFESGAGDLVSGDTNRFSDIFLRDRITGTTRCVSLGQGGENANGESRDAVISPNGRFVSFVSSASNLVPVDTNGIADVFVWDMQLDTITLASPRAVGPTISYLSEFPQITPDGRYVAFYSTATGLVANVETSGEIYLRDLQDGTTEWISTNATTILQSTYGITNSAVSYNHVISTNGRYVAFQASRREGTSAASLILRHDRQTSQTEVVHTNAFVPNTDRGLIRNLSMTPDGQYVAFISNVGPTNQGTNAIFVWDGTTGSTTLVSGDSNGMLQPGSVAAAPMITPNGRFVVFRHSAELTTNSVAGDCHLYVRDLALGTTTLVNLGANGSSEVSAASIPYISDDGRFVAFEAFDGSLMLGDHNRASDIFVRDLQADSTELISARDLEAPPVSLTSYSTLSRHSVNYNGRYIAFVSTAENMVEDDNNRVPDVFLKDVVTGTTKLVSISTNGVSANGMSYEPSISADGRYVAFTSVATDLAANVTNRIANVYLRDMESSNVVLISKSFTGRGANGASSSPQLSADGQLLMFRSSASDMLPISVSGQNLYLTALTNGQTIALTTSGVLGADMTPDGRYIAFHGRPNFPSPLMIWDTQAGARVFTNESNPFHITISPSGSYVSLIENSQLKVIDWRNKTTRTVGPVSQLPRRHSFHFSQNEKFLAFVSTNNQSVITDTNGTSDVFLYELGTGVKTHVSRKHNTPEAANGPSEFPWVSSDGWFVVFRSRATDLVEGNWTSEPKIYVYDRIAGTTRFLSTSVSTGADYWSFAPVVSRDGRAVVFGSPGSSWSAMDLNPGLDLFHHVFLYSAVSRNLDGAPRITWPTAPGESYRVQFKNSINDAVWQVLNGDISVSGAEASMADSDPLAPQRIYRVVAE